MSDVVWKAPGPRQRMGAVSDTADQLRANPGQWAVIDEYKAPTEPAPGESVEDYKDALRRVRARASSRASQITQGRVPAYRHTGPEPGAFQALTQTEFDPDGSRVIRVFAVYLVGQEALDYLAKVKEEKANRAAKKAAVVSDSPSDETSPAAASDSQLEHA